MSLLGVASGDGCTCGLARLHSITCLAVAKGEPRAMVNDDQDVFYPDNPEDAAWFAQHEHARPLHPDQFPPGWLP